MPVCNPKVRRDAKALKAPRNPGQQRSATCSLQRARALINDHHYSPHRSTVAPIRRGVLWVSIVSRWHTGNSRGSAWPVVQPLPSTQVRKLAIRQVRKPALRLVGAVCWSIAREGPEVNYSFAEAVRKGEGPEYEIERELLRRRNGATRRCDSARGPSTGPATKDATFSAPGAEVKGGFATWDLGFAIGEEGDWRGTCRICAGGPLALNTGVRR